MNKLLSFLIKKAVGFYINLFSYIYPEKASRLAYKFFSEPRSGRLTEENLPEVLKKAKAEIITHNDFIYQTYTWKGGLQKILLVHGWESNASRWELLLPYLQKSGSTIIAVDAPAHGLSSGNEFNIPQYAEFINLMITTLKPDFMIGHSLGGITALYQQSHYPDNSIEKMVILGAPCDLTTILKNYRGMLSLNKKVFRLMENHFLNHFKIKTEQFSGKVFASKIKTKGLIAHDINDEVVSFKEGKKIAQAWKNAEFLVTEGLGHSMHDHKLYSKIYNFLFQNN